MINGWPWSNIQTKREKRAGWFGSLANDSSWVNNISTYEPSNVQHWLGLLVATRLPWLSLQEVDSMTLIERQVRAFPFGSQNHNSYELTMVNDYEVHTPYYNLAHGGYWWTVMCFLTTYHLVQWCSAGFPPAFRLAQVIELFGNSFYSGDLGPSTIVGAGKGRHVGHSLGDSLGVSFADSISESYDGDGHQERCMS